MSKDLLNNLNFSKKATLTYLTNPVYQNNINKNKQEICEKNKYKKSDIKFYRKRILDLTRNMFKGEYPDNNLKTVFLSYVDSLIDYLITIDERDIIQEDYNFLSSSDISGTTLHDNSLNTQYENDYNYISNVDNLMMMEKSNQTLDEFVIKNTISEKDDFIPQKKEINLKDSMLKTKGIRKNKNKNKI